MNFVTHFITALVGGLLTALGLLGPDAARGDLVTAGVAFGICHLLPDLEVLLRKKGTMSQLTQRAGMTHSLLFCATIPWAIGLIGIGGGTQSYLICSAAGLIGYFTHLLLDFITPYPMAIFWPWKRRFCLGLLFFKDYGLMLGLFMGAFFYGSPMVALGILGLFMGLYIGIRIGFLVYARYRFPFFKSQLGREKIEEVAWIPDTFQPWCWKVAIRTDDSFHAWDIDMLTNIKKKTFKVSRREAGLVRRARAVPLVREIDAFTPFFALTEHPPEEGETKVKVTGHDIRYHFFGKDNPLRVDLVYDGNKLVDSTMH